MRKARIIIYLKYLKENTYISSEELSLKMDISSRTVRNELKELNNIIGVYGADIITKPKQGSKIVIRDVEKYETYLNMMINEPNHELPDNTEDRIRFLLQYFLQAKDYVKIDDLCDILYISKTSLSSDIKYVRELLGEYHLKLESKPNYGLKVQGSEFNLRLCIANYAINSTLESLNQCEIDEQKNSLAEINQILSDCFKEINYSISDTSFQNLILHIFITLKRIQDNCYVPMDQEIHDLVQEKDINLAKDIVKKLEANFNITIPQSETLYISVHLASKEIINQGINKNIIVSEEVNNIVTNMLNEIKKTYKMDFSDDFELRMMLALHLIPFQVRIKYGINLHNPILKDIKTKFTLSYNLAVSCCSILKKIYYQDISEDEIGYFALHLNLALERKKKCIHKKNIIIVCGSGRGTSKFLQFQLREEFGKYLNNIETSDLMNLKNVDFENIDYIITTVPIPFVVPVPILEVTCFLEDTDMKNIKQILQRNKSSIINYFNHKLFLCNVNFDSREKVLQYMVQEIKKVKKDIPVDFYESIMKRERLAPTEFGNMIAMPHPYEALTKETFICIMILNKPITWVKKKVQFIYLMSITDDPNRELQYLYSVTSKMLTNKKMIKELIQKKDYNVLCENINNIESEMR